MTEYIYIVKCPGCEDEMFNFFTDARMQCDLVMSKHPIITQVEVERNDFGECTDHHDLGTVWSWEEAMKDTESGYTDAEPTKSVFTKDDLKLMADGKDPEFDNLDNSVDFEPEISDRKPISENAIQDGGFRTDGYRTALACYDSDDFDINVEFGMQDEEEYEVEDQLYLLQPGQTVADLVVYLSRECGFTSIYVYGETGANRNEIRTATRFTTVPGAHDYRHYGTIEDRLVEECTEKDRKPVPDGMTIEQLVEEMEENEDEVECALCNDLFDKDTCRKELNLGWLCRRCADDLVARGEGPVFKEDNYWDFLDEGATYFAGRDEGTFDPSKYCEFTYTFDHDEYGELEAVFQESYADILEALKEIVDDDYVRELSEEDEPQTEAEWKAAGKWDEFFTVDITAHISNLTDELVEYFEEDREEAVKEAVKEAEENDDGADRDGFYGWDDYYKWKNGDYTRW